jgi:hypothetical protein
MCSDEKVPAGEFTDRIKMRTMTTFFDVMRTSTIHRIRVHPSDVLRFLQDMQSLQETMKFLTIFIHEAISVSIFEIQSFPSNLFVPILSRRIY